MAENRSDSNAELIIFTGRPSAAKPEVELKFIPTVVPMAVEPGQPARKPKAVNKPKARALTEAQKRTRKIRGWMLSQSSRPDLETYRRAMDLAKVAPPPACRRAGKESFDESFKVHNLKGSIRAEFSRLWRTRSPQ